MFLNPWAGKSVIGQKGESQNGEFNTTFRNTQDEKGYNSSAEISGSK